MFPCLSLYVTTSVLNSSAFLFNSKAFLLNSISSFTYFDQSLFPVKNDVADWNRFPITLTGKLPIFLAPNSNVPKNSFLFAVDYNLAFSIPFSFAFLNNGFVWSSNVAIALFSPWMNSLTIFKLFNLA